jgi:hypothetical protein
MLMRFIVFLFVVAILYSLGSGLFYLVRDTSSDHMKLAKALTWRIGLSILLFCLLFLAFSMGWIKPHGM